MQINQYMQEKFPHLELKPPLFYNWNIGIRFELGLEQKWKNNHSNSSYIQECYRRAITLFESIHSPTDSIFVIVDVNDYHKGKHINRKLKNFPPYVERSLLYKLSYQLMPYIFPEDDEEGKYRTHRFTLKCKTSDLKYIPLLKAICNQDLGVKPSFFNKVYFININKNTIFHVYDDRGCDLLATSPETIRGIYDRYNDWILDYDRAEIEKVFD